MVKLETESAPTVLAAPTLDGVEHVSSIAGSFKARTVRRRQHAVMVFVGMASVPMVAVVPSWAGAERTVPWIIQHILVTVKCALRVPNVSADFVAIMPTINMDPCSNVARPFVKMTGMMDSGPMTVTDFLPENKPTLPIKMTHLQKSFPFPTF